MGWLAAFSHIDVWWEIAIITNESLYNPPGKPSINLHTYQSSQRFRVCKVDNLGF